MSPKATLTYWLKGRTQQQRALILVAAVIIILWLWFMLWESAYQTSYVSVFQQTQTFVTQIDQATQKNSTMKQILADPALNKKRDQLKKELTNVSAQLQSFSTQVVSSSEMVKALQTVLNEDPDLVLSDLKNTANFIITPPGAEKTNTKKLYQHDFTLTFEGNYFSTLTYLKKLEALPWKFYWDSIEYTVTKYPNATITLKLHTISHDEGLLNV